MTLANFFQFSVAYSFAFELHAKYMLINLLLFRDTSEEDFAQPLSRKLVFRIENAKIAFLEFILKRMPLRC
jgi:hypothetical protein